MSTLTKKIQEFDQRRLDLQTELVNRGVPLEAFDAAIKLCSEGFEEGFEEGRKLGLKTNGKKAKGQRTSVYGSAAVIQALAGAMGKRALTADQATEALVRTGWKTESKDPKHVVSTLLGQNTPNVFERVSRGLYRVATKKVTPNPRKAKASLTDFSADSLWQYLVGGPFETFTVRELADHIECDARCLPSPLSKLCSEGRLHAMQTEGKNTYRVKR